MVRRVVVRLVAWLLIVNGIAGVAAVWAGWSVTTGLLDGLRQSSTLVSAQQARLVASVRGVAVGVDDASEATAGLSRSTTQMRGAVNDATRTANQLASTFDRLSQASQVTVFGVRPLEGLAEPFSTNAADSRQLGVSLGQTADSLATNVQEMTRVSNDLKSIQGQVSTAAGEVEALPAASVIQQGLASLELASRLLLGMIFFEATLSALTGLALLMMVGQPRAQASSGLPPSEL
jgi:uncharacterized phage infection (PIP) family protein YhgE